MLTDILHVLNWDLLALVLYLNSQIHDLRAATVHYVDVQVLCTCLAFIRFNTTETIDAQRVMSYWVSVPADIHHDRDRRSVDQALLDDLADGFLNLLICAWRLQALTLELHHKVVLLFLYSLGVTIYLHGLFGLCRCRTTRFRIRTESVCNLKWVDPQLACTDGPTIHRLRQQLHGCDHLIWLLSHGIVHKRCFTNLVIHSLCLLLNLQWLISLMFCGFWRLSRLLGLQWQNIIFECLLGDLDLVFWLSGFDSLIFLRLLLLLVFFFAALFDSIGRVSLNLKKVVWQ